MKDAVKTFEYLGFNIEMHYDETPQNPRRDWDGQLGTMVCFNRRYDLGDEDHNFSDLEDLGMFLGLYKIPRPFKKDYFKPITDTLLNDYEFNILVGDYPTSQRREYVRMINKEAASGDFTRLNELRAERQKERYDSARMDWQDYVDKKNDSGYGEFKGLCFALSLYEHSGITMRMSSQNGEWDDNADGYIYITAEDMRKHFEVSKLTKEHYETMQTYLKGEVETYDDYLRGNVYGFMTYNASTDEDDEVTSVGDVIDSVWGYYGYDEKESGLLQSAQESIDYHIDEWINEYQENVDDWKAQGAFAMAQL